jgi:hypothetical protein
MNQFAIPLKQGFSLNFDKLTEAYQEVDFSYLIAAGCSQLNSKRD